MKKKVLRILIILAFVAGMQIGNGIAQGGDPPAIKIGLAIRDSNNVYKDHFDLEEDIWAVLSLEVVGSTDIIAVYSKKLHLFLKFYSENGELVTSAHLMGRDDLMPPPKKMTVDGEEIWVYPVRRLAGTASADGPWAWKVDPYIVQTFFELPCRKYSVKAEIPMITFTDYFETLAGDVYAPTSSTNWSGYLESVPVNLTYGTQYCATDAKPQVLTMRYTGKGCGGTSNSQVGDTCEDYFGEAPSNFIPIRIMATSHQNPFQQNAKVWFDSDLHGPVELNGIFTIDAARAGETRLGGETYISIFHEGQLLEKVGFHSSCSEPLSCSDRFGSFELLDFTPQ